MSGEEHKPGVYDAAKLAQDMHDAFYNQSELARIRAENEKLRDDLAGCRQSLNFLERYGAGAEERAALQAAEAQLAQLREAIARHLNSDWDRCADDEKLLAALDTQEDSGWVTGRSR